MAADAEVLGLAKIVEEGSGEKKDKAKSEATVTTEELKDEVQRREFSAVGPRLAS